MSPSTRFGIPLLIGAFCFLFMSHFTENMVYAWLAIPQVIALAIVYILSPQINWYFYNKNPPRMPPPLIRFLDTRFEFYKNLHPNQKKQFRDRVMLYMEAKAFKPQGGDDLPPDIKAVIAASAVQLTLGLEDYLLPKFENIIVYLHPFPSPQYPENWHVSEIYEEDGVIMFCADHLMRGFLEPDKYYPIGLHEYANAFIVSNPNIQFPNLGESIWNDFENISRFRKNAIEKWIGLPNINPLPVAIAHYVAYPKNFRAVNPSLFRELNNIFQLY